MSDQNPSDQKRAVRDGYDQLASEYDRQRSEDPVFLDDLCEHVPAGGGILDAGCGSGRPVAELLATDYDVVGLDLSGEQVGMARERIPAPGQHAADERQRAADERADDAGEQESVADAREVTTGGRFVQGDVTSLPFDSEAFDGIAAYYSVIHVPTDQHPATAREFARVLRPGGHLLLTVGTDAWEGENDDWLDTGVEMRWTIPGPDETESLLEDAGFEVVWRRITDDSLGEDACFVLARKQEERD